MLKYTSTFLKSVSMTDSPVTFPEPHEATSLDDFCPPHLRRAARQLAPLLYADLKRIAHSERSRHISPQTLNTTALVHDAFLRLADNQAFESHAHFLRVAAVTMRHLLVDRARAQLAVKHGGHMTRVDLEHAGDFYVKEDEWVVAMHEALSRLARFSQRMADVVECRVFSGYDDDEIANALGVSPRTVQRDWTMARAWLRRELVETEPGQGAS
jgi:RNA polymerase sigma factor (TIGR02999 family)